MTYETMKGILVDYMIATEDEVDLVRAINGKNEKVCLDILYVRTGYRNFEQFFADLNE